MNYRDTIDYINSFINFEKIPKYQYAAAFKLERMNAILKALGDPHKGLNIIHVAGSKGKGSTCVITAYILKEAGYKTGLYTSPHLVNFRERIRILNGEPPDLRGFKGMICEEEISEILKEIKPVVENFREHKTLGNASFFEVLTACAFLHFKKKKVDAAVLETGLGGRLDATNAGMPLVAGITNISLEHTDKLGDTLGKIAHEKAGIIKSQKSSLDFARDKKGKRQKLKVVSARQEKEAIEVIRRVCRERNASLYEVGKDIEYFIKSSDENKQVFDLKGPGYSYENLEMNLIGAHQIENASLSIGMLKLIGQEKFNIREGDIRKGLQEVIWPGRLQVIQKNPYIILDGAQNPASASALADSIKKLFNYKKLICVFGISSDKDIKGVSSVLDAVSDIIILTKAKNNPRAEDISRLRQNFQSLPLSGPSPQQPSPSRRGRCEARPCLEGTNNINEAMQKALKLADKDDLILVTGSLFVVGDAMQYFKL